jgi:hypothetical protein
MSNRSAIFLGRGAVGRRRQLVELERLQEPLVAAPDHVRQLEVDQVPGDVAGFDLGFDLGKTAVVVLGQDLNAGLLLERLVIGLDLAHGIGAAPGDHGQVLGGRGAAEAERRHRQRGAGGEQSEIAHL